MFPWRPWLIVHVDMYQPHAWPASHTEHKYFFFFILYWPLDSCHKPGRRAMLFLLYLASPPPPPSVSQWMNQWTSVWIWVTSKVGTSVIASIVILSIPRVSRHWSPRRYHLGIPNVRFHRLATPYAATFSRQGACRSSTLPLRHHYSDRVFFLLLI